MYLAEGPVLMLMENGTQWRSWGTLHPPAPSERIIPTRNGTYGTSTPGPRAGVVRGTLLLVTYVMYAVVGMGLPHPNIWECLAAL